MSCLLDLGGAALLLAVLRVQAFMVRMQLLLG
jgi:hypothetical protein